MRFLQFSSLLATLLIAEYVNAEPCERSTGFSLAVQTDYRWILSRYSPGADILPNGSTSHGITGGVEGGGQLGEYFQISLTFSFGNYLYAIKESPYSEVLIYTGNIGSFRAILWLQLVLQVRKIPLVFRPGLGISYSTYWGSMTYTSKGFEYEYKPKDKHRAAFHGRLVIDWLLTPRWSVGIYASAGTQNTEYVGSSGLQIGYYIPVER